MMSAAASQRVTMRNLSTYFIRQCDLIPTTLKGRAISAEFVMELADAISSNKAEAFQRRELVDSRRSLSSEPRSWMLTEAGAQSA